MDIILEILEKITPIIIAIIIVYLGYRIWLKQKNFEEKNNKLREIRQSVSNLLLIWKELSKFERSLNPKDPYNVIVFSNSKLLRKFLKIDRPKIDRLKKSYIESIDNLRSYDITLFYDLESSFENYTNSFSDFLDPILTDKAMNIKHKYKLIFPLLQETIGELEEIIIKTSNYLDKDESNSIINILHYHSEEINKPQEFEEIPEFIVDIVNSFFPLKDAITKNDFHLLYQNETVRWLIIKILSSKLISFIFEDKPIDGLKFLLGFEDGEMEQLNEFFENIDKETLIDFLTISEEDSNQFLNNKEFYNLIMGLFIKIEEKVPFEIKRFFVKLNNGEINLKSKLDEIKLQITTSC